MTKSTKQASKQASKQAELENCNFVKTILMIIVVFYHCILFWGGNWFVGKPVISSYILNYVSKWLNTFHVYGFALVSGYLFYFLRFEKGKYNDIKEFVKNKAKRLLIPYVFVALVWVIPITLIFFEYDVAQIISKYVFATSPSQLWFLIMLFDVFMIFWLMSKFFEKYNVAGFFMALVLYAVALAGSSIIPNVFLIWTACKYVLFFLLGFKIRQCGSNIIMKIPGVILLVAHIFMFILTVYLENFDVTIIKLINLGLKQLLNVVGAVMSFALLQKIAYKVNYKRSKIYGVLSKNSMSIYLFHQQIIYFTLYTLNGCINPYVHTIINFVVAITASLLIATALKRFKATRFLLGEK